MRSRRKEKAHTSGILYAVALLLLWSTFVLAYDLKILRPHHSFRRLSSGNEESEMLRFGESKSEQMLRQTTVPSPNSLGSYNYYQNPGVAHLRSRSNYNYIYVPTQSPVGFGLTLGGNQY